MAGETDKLSVPSLADTHQTTPTAHSNKPTMYGVTHTLHAVRRADSVMYLDLSLSTTSNFTNDDSILSTVTVPVSGMACSPP